MSAGPVEPKLRFGPFEVDLERRVLRKHGVRIKLQTQPFQILAALLENSGATVTREELRKRLWPDNTFVDFEHGLNAAVARLRYALSDSPDHPRYIETLAKLGYRFAAKVTPDGAAAGMPIPTPTQPKGDLSGSVSPEARIGWAGFWIALAVVLAAGGIAFYSTSHREPQADAVPLTTFRGFEGNPALSPDGFRLAFAWNGQKQDNFDVYVISIPFVAPLRLTTDPAEDISPVWSPDGRTLAFLRRFSGHSDLMLVPSSGGPEHTLAKTREITWFHPRKATALAWSPDGRWIAASHHEPDEPNDGIYLFSLTGEKRRLTAPPRGVRSDNMPAFSPGGRHMAFSRIPGGFGSEIYMLPLDSGLQPSGPARPLTDNKRWSAQPVWTPDGRQILYVFGNDSIHGHELRVINVGHPQPPMRAIDLVHEISEFTLGRRLVYSRQIEDTNVWRAELPKRPGAVAAGEPLLASTLADQTAMYSPDGRKIAFASSRSGSREIWVANADGSDAVPMTSFGGPVVGCPAWSRDGQWIAFHARPEGRVDVFVIPAAGGPAKVVTTNSWLPRYSQNGHWLYFSSRRSGDVEIWKMPVQGGDPVQITTSGHAQLPIESVDGKVLYYLRQDRNEIWTVPVQGGRSARVLGPTEGYPAGFTVTAQGIYYSTPQRAGHERYINFFKFSTGETSAVAIAARPFHTGMSVSPDLRYILYDQYDELGSDLMMIDNFRIP